MQRSVMCSLINFIYFRGLNCVSKRPVPVACLSTTSKLGKDAKPNVHMTKKLQKLIDRGNAKWSKKKYYDFKTQTPKDYHLTEGGEQSKKSDRADKISKILHQHIEDIICNGELHPQIGQLSVKIVKVKTSRDLSNTVIYWASSSNEKRDKEVAELLERNTKKLRGMLIGRRVFGFIPGLTFARDKTQGYLEELDKILATIDYGPDYTPGSWRTRIMEQANSTMNVEQIEENPDLVPGISVNSHDIYDLDRQAIMKRLMESMNKVKKRSADRGTMSEDVLVDHQKIKEKLNLQKSQKQKLIKKARRNAKSAMYIDDVEVLEFYTDDYEDDLDVSDHEYDHDYDKYDHDYDKYDCDHDKYDCDHDKYDDNHDK